MPEREEFRVDGLNEPISHYTDAVRFGDLLFISGIAPVDENLDLVGGTTWAPRRAGCSRTWTGF